MIVITRPTRSSRGTRLRASRSSAANVATLETMVATQKKERAGASFRISRIVSG